MGECTPPDSPIRGQSRREYQYLLWGTPERDTVVAFSCRHSDASLCRVWGRGKHALGSELRLCPAIEAQSGSPLMFLSLECRQQDQKSFVFIHPVLQPSVLVKAPQPSGQGSCPPLGRQQGGVGGGVRQKLRRMKSEYPVVCVTWAVALTSLPLACLITA